MARLVAEEATYKTHYRNLYSPPVQIDIHNTGDDLPKRFSFRRSCARKVQGKMVCRRTGRVTPKVCSSIASPFFSKALFHPATLDSFSDVSEPAICSTKLQGTTKRLLLLDCPTTIVIVCEKFISQKNNTIAMNKGSLVAKMTSRHTWETQNQVHLAR